MLSLLTEWNSNNCINTPGLPKSILFALVVFNLKYQHDVFLNVKYLDWNGQSTAVINTSVTEYVSYFCIIVYI